MCIREFYLGCFLLLLFGPCFFFCSPAEKEDKSNIDIQVQYNRYSLHNYWSSFMHWSRTFFSEKSFNQGYSKRTSNNVGITKIITENDWTTTLHTKYTGSTQVKNCTYTQTFFFKFMTAFFFYLHL